MVYTVTMSDAKFYGAAAEYNKAPGSGLNARVLKLVLLVVAALVLITVGFFAFKAFTGASANDAARLVARERVLLSFINTNSATLVDEDLKTANSNTLSLLTSDGYALQNGLKTTFDITTPPDDITLSEADSTSAKTLLAAKTQSRFDQAYVQLLRDKVAAAQQLARTVLASSSGSMKVAAQTNIDHLTVIDTQLSKLSL
jgi:hypothetical protein